MSWKNFEIYVKNLFSDDNARLIPGSGSTKNEEDVSGISTIAQCKYTNNKNLTLLEKDIDRLLEAAKLYGKYPMFFNSNNKHKILSLFINEDDLFNSITEIILFFSLCEKVINDLSITDKEDYEMINRLKYLKKNKINKIRRNILNKINTMSKDIDNKLDSAYIKSINMDLFD